MVVTLQPSQAPGEHDIQQISQWEAMRNGRGVQKTRVPKTVYQLSDQAQEITSLLSSPETCLGVNQFSS